LGPAIAAAAAAAAEEDDVLSGPAGRCGEVCPWAYITLAASVASREEEVVP